MSRPLRAVCLVCFSVSLLIVSAWLKADPPEPPALSKVVAADDLAAQLKDYLSDLEQSVDDADEYKSSADKVKRTANTMAVLALVLARHDGASDLKPAAPAILAAAQQAAKAKDFEAAKTAIAALRSAVDGKQPAGGEPRWEKVASLGQIMEEAENLNTRLRGSMRRFDPRRSADNARAAAVMAAIAQASIYDTHEVKDAKQLPEWYRMAGEMRDAAGDLSAQIKARDKAAATAAIGRLEQSCKNCHAVFQER